MTGGYFAPTAKRKAFIAWSYVITNGTAVSATLIVDNVEVRKSALIFFVKYLNLISFECTTLFSFLL